MHMYTQGHSRLISTGAYIPEQRVTSREIMEQIDSENRFGLDVHWLERVTGIIERRVSDPGLEPSDIASLAALEALDCACCLVKDVDAIIYAGMTRDKVEPSTAHYVQHKLGAKNAIALDVSNACLGFMNGIHLMDALIATGQVRRGLIVTGEQGSRYVQNALELLINTRDREMLNRLAAGLTLGDAGGAVLLGPKLGPDSGIMELGIGSNGAYANLCTIRNDFASLETDMTPLFQETAKMAYELYTNMMNNRLKWSPDRLDFYIPHQVGIKALRVHARKAGVDMAKVPNIISTMGNIISATFPVALTQLLKENKLKQGQRLFLSGTGSGISIAQAGVIWDATYIG